MKHPSLFTRGKLNLWPQSNSEAIEQAYLSNNPHLDTDPLGPLRLDWGLVWVQKQTGEILTLTPFWFRKDQVQNIPQQQVDT